MSHLCVDETKDMKRAIRSALMDEWDPIGVRDIPEAADEYDGYVENICQALTTGASREDVFNYLWWVETDHMGLPGDRATTERFAQQLVDLRENLKCGRG